MPDAVVSEVSAGAATDPARLALDAGWGKRASPRDIPSALIEWGLGAGETSVLALAMERQPCTAILDDALARDCARAFQVPLIGTLGVILRAKKLGLIPSAAQVFAAVRQAGLHLDDSVIRMVLVKAGEQWPLNPGNHPRGNNVTL